MLEINHQATTQREVFPVIPEEKVAHLRAQFSKRNFCNCGYIGLHSKPIQGYSGHLGGWDIGEASYWWLFIVCPKCDYAWSLWKLGVARERY